ncbi:uncharacterized protein LOC120204768 [Hibiscus syriacus]|uniref:uncharacterized protein LOC120204768 n=1 Tax=Hibiscus syriacus TaxID=106335 RepID=UPI0019245101|nr:uncharacterized protein LOC120204768 [Hibiscus syriacus]
MENDELCTSSLDCGFNLHNKVVELPPKIKHPIRKNHPLILRFRVENLSCNACNQRLPAHGLRYSCSPCKFAIHITCPELPPTLDLPCHRKHPLVLEFQNSPSCKTSKETRYNNFVYLCSSCNFNLHYECASAPPTIKGKTHEHPFTLLWRQVSFICDACGVEGCFVSYICSTCSLVVHKKCISLPPIIAIPRHDHTRFSANISSDLMSSRMVIVKFVIRKSKWSMGVTLAPIVIEAKLLGDLTIVPRRSTNPIICIEKNKHDLILKANPMEEHIDGANLMEKYCDGCVLPISNPFYHCSQCDFFLHKTCAESPMEKRLWFHICQQFLILVVDHIFRCGL